MRNIVLIFCITYINVCFSQTNLYIPISGSNTNKKYLNYRTVPPSLENFTSIKNQADLILSDNGGKVLLSYNYFGIVNTYGDIILSKDSLGSNLSRILNPLLIRINDSIAALIYYNIYHLDHKKEQLFYSFIDFKYKNGIGRTIPSKTNIVLKTGKLDGMDICRTFDGNYLLVAQVDSNLFLFKVDERGVSLNDSINNFIDKGYPNLSGILPNDDYTYKQNYHEIQFSHSGNFLISNVRKYLTFTLKDSTLPIYSENIMKIIYFNKQNNKFIANQNEILSRSIYLRNNLYLNNRYIKPYALKILSPNNKYLFTENSIQNSYPFYSIDTNIDKSQYLQYDLGTKKYIDSFEIPFRSYLNSSNYLSSYHNLYLFIAEKPETPLLYQINPNKPIFSKNMNYLGKYNQQIKIYYNPDIYEYVKINPRIVYNCVAKVDFMNESDFSGGLVEFQWIFQNDLGKNDTLFGLNQQRTYSKNGKYAFKVFASSTINGGYGEWYYDTITINIPEKPIVNFKVLDTTVCQYLPIKLINLTKSSITKPGFKPIYVWNFGDGSPISNDLEPIHLFSKPGIYTIELFYNNGYCDNTLVRNQYIRVVDAPKPGFSINNRQGCAPFLAEFIDTVSLNVTRKEYLFTDSSKWNTISTTKFNHTFRKPGTYWAIQKLYGFTGCIMRTDSIQIFVSKGFLDSDSIKVLSASYDTSNYLHLKWESHPAATHYVVYRSNDKYNFKPLITSNENFAIDSNALTKSWYYKILGVDSCGKVSKVKNIAKPQWINLELLKNNEASLISYSPIEGFNSRHFIELESTLNYAKNLTQLEISPLNPFKDNNFTNQGDLKKCYRMSVVTDNLKMYSNFSCLNFEPQIFIPNSFSPNLDGLNDVFSPNTLGILSYDLKIFNRWGELLYSGSIPWDGTFKGKIVEDGVYMYQLIFLRNDNNVNLYTGMVHLLK